MTPPQAGPSPRRPVSSNTGDVVPSGAGERDAPTAVPSSVTSEIWHACAGPLAVLPAVGSKVVYFPQGHLEQAHPESDQVYAQLTLQPLEQAELISSEYDDLASQSESEVAALLPEEERPGRVPGTMFCKMLTASDTSTHGGLSIPRRAAETCLPPLDYDQQPPAQSLTAWDLHGVCWTFRHIYRGFPKRHLLTTGWSTYVTAKGLTAGDYVIFIRAENGQLQLGTRRALRQQLGTRHPSPLLFPESLYLGPDVLASAAHALATQMPFTVSYNPRCSLSPFVIPYQKFRVAMGGRTSAAGLRFKMACETDDSFSRRFRGKVLSVDDADPIHWPNSLWRSLNVGWDEDIAANRQNRVSPWEIEPMVPLGPIEGNLKIKRLRTSIAQDLRAEASSQPFSGATQAGRLRVQDQSGGDGDQSEDRDQQGVTPGRALPGSAEDFPRSGSTSGATTTTTASGGSRAVASAVQSEPSNLATPPLAILRPDWLVPPPPLPDLAAPADISPLPFPGLTAQEGPVLRPGTLTPPQLDPLQFLRSFSSSLDSQQALIQQQQLPQLEPQALELGQRVQGSSQETSPRRLSANSFFLASQSSPLDSPFQYLPLLQGLPAGPITQASFPLVPLASVHIKEPSHRENVPVILQDSREGPSQAAKSLEEFGGRSLEAGSCQPGQPQASSSPGTMRLTPGPEGPPECGGHAAKWQAETGPAGDPASRDTGRQDPAAASSGYGLSRLSQAASQVSSAHPSCYADVEWQNSITSPAHSDINITTATTNITSLAAPTPAFTRSSSTTTVPGTPLPTFLFGVPISNPFSLTEARPVNGDQCQPTHRCPLPSNGQPRPATQRSLPMQQRSKNGCSSGDSQEVDHRASPRIKVYLPGSIGRKLDIRRLTGYADLKHEVALLFGLLEDELMSKYRVAYMDLEGDVLLVGDEPWGEFLMNVKNLQVVPMQEIENRIWSKSEAKGAGSLSRSPCQTELPSEDESIMACTSLSLSLPASASKQLEEVPSYTMMLP